MSYDSVTATVLRYSHRLSRCLPYRSAVYVLTWLVFIPVMSLITLPILVAAALMRVVADWLDGLRAEYALLKHIIGREIEEWKARKQH